MNSRDINSKYDIAVVGAGIAGISIALRLKKRGFQVCVLEKNSTPGGKLTEFSWNGYRWDKGPSLFTLPNQVDDLFLLFNKKPSDYFTYEKQAESCHYYFPDGSDFLMTSNQKELEQNLTGAFGNERQEVLDYFSESKQTYETIGDLFIEYEKYGLKDVFNKRLVKHYPALFSPKLMGSLNRFNSRKFKNQNLVQLFNRFGTYNGSDPYKMSGLYSMIAHLEINDGTYFPKQGMRSIVMGLYQLAVEVGIDFYFDEKDLKCTKEPLGYQVETNSEILEVKRLVSAIDCVTFYKNVLNDTTLANKYATKERSSSGLIFYWAVEKIIPEIKLHNILFSSDYQKEFNQIFDKKELPDEPTIYLHVSSVVNKQDAPENGQNWFLMINTPAGKEITETYRAKMRSYIISLIQRKFNTDISDCIKREHYWDAQGIADDTGSYLGALYGASSNKMTAALTRHGNTSKKYPNLYFCGGTVHPGGGIPLVLKSAKIVDQIIANES